MSTHRPPKKVLETMPLSKAATHGLPTVLNWATPAALVFLALALMVMHRAGGLPVERLRAAVADRMAPVLSAAAWPLSSAFDLHRPQSLAAENAALRDENQRLRQWYETALKLKSENQSLRELLHVKADPALGFVTARVMADASGSFLKSVLVPVGAEDHIEKGAAVLTGRGLVGRVTEVGENSARVLLLTDINSRLPVRVQDMRIKGILAGKNRDLLRLERLPPDSKVALGQRIVTSGDGGPMPEDIPIGEITAIDDGGIWVRPFSDMARTAHVQIVNVAPAAGKGKAAR